ncbi:MAG: NAD(P)-dependent oxidoreductase [Candidatus Bathyarchaeia archaeon]
MGKTIGILGIGHIRSRVATITKGFGMTVLLHDPILLLTYLEQFDKAVEQSRELIQPNLLIWKAKIFYHSCGNVATILV